MHKHTHTCIKQNAESLRSNNDCNIGWVCWMECEMSRSLFLSRNVFIPIYVWFFYDRNDAENNYLVIERIGKVKKIQRKRREV